MWRVKPMLLALFFLSSSAAWANESDLAEPSDAAYETLLVLDRSPAGLQNSWLEAHNVHRLAMGLKPLIWDGVLAQDAEKWALHLSSNNLFEHFVDNRAHSQGENLWMGTRGRYKAEEMTGMWLDESQHVKSGVFPDISKTGSWADVAHYSQMLWPSTQRVGCALSSNSEDDFLVCRYFPAGNRIGDPFQAKSGK